jgi:WD40 repeat protein
VQKALVWDPETGTELRTLSGHQGSVRAVAALLDGRVVSGSIDNTLKVWDPTTGTCVATLTMDCGVLSVSWASDGSILLTGDTGGGVSCFTFVTDAGIP